MPSDIFEEPLEIEIGLLEAGVPTADSYPYPSLAASRKTQTVTFRGVILENAYLRATFVPALGGRLLSILDKRTGIQLLSTGGLVPRAGGRRGSILSAGIELHLDGRSRLTSLGAVQFAAEEATEDRPAGLWMSEAVTGTGLSWHIHASVPDDCAEIRIEARVFNRTQADISYNAGLLMPALAESQTAHDVFVTQSHGDGVALIPERGAWSGSLADGSVVLSRFESPRPIAPRQLDTWMVSIVPFSGLSGVSAVSLGAALFASDQLIKIQAAQQLTGHKLVLLTRSGQTLETALDAYPEKLLEMTVPEPVTAVALMDPARKVILKWEEGAWIPLGEPKSDNPRSPIARPLDDLEAATFDVGTRHIAHALLGQRSLATNEYDEAELQFEQSLLYNGEDHLTWWMKAMARRLRGGGSEEAPELLNAHYLAPLEPALRAESFLSQPATMERAPNPLLKPMEEYPEHFIEVAALFVEAGLYEQASRWIDEALRHIDLPMLRYLLAYSHLKATNMVLEASKHVSTASSQPLGPPYPWRTIEIEVVRFLADRFPDDDRLSELRGIGAGR